MNRQVFFEQWPGFIEKIENADPSMVEMCQTAEGVIKDSESWFESLSLPEGLETLFVYGIGSGYEYFAAKKWLDESSGRLLFFFEDDFALLSNFFETERAKEILNHPQVLIVPFESKVQKLQMHFSDDLERILYTAVNASYSTVFSSFYKKSRPDFCTAFSQFIHLKIGEFKWSMHFLKIDVIKQSFKNMCHNLLALPSLKNGEHLFGKFNDIPAIICAAGPSIKEQLPLLKRLKNRALIFGAGTGMNTLNQGGVLPHLGCGIDPNLSSESRIKTNTAYEVPYFVTSQFNDKAQKLLHGPQLYFKGGGVEKSNDWFLDELGLDRFTHLSFSVSTTCACLAIAHRLGCNPVIFTGIDLSYTGDKRYIEDVQTHPTDRASEGYIIKKIPEESLIKAKNLLGKTIYTRTDWIIEGTYYTQYATVFPKLHLINATKEGLLLSGINHRSLDSLLMDQLSISYDLDNWVFVEMITAPQLKVAKESAYKQLHIWKRGLQECQQALISLLKILLDKDHSNALESKQYVKALNDFLETVSYQIFLKQLDASFQKLAMREQIKLRYHSSCYSEVELYEKKLEIELVRLRFLHDYAQEQQQVIDALDHEEFDESEEAIAELFDVECDYRFENGDFEIDDDDLNIHFKERFIPKTIGEASETIDSESQRFFASCVEGVPDGECLLYFLSGKIKARWYYKEGKLHGPSSFYTEEGKLLARGWFVDDERQGRNLQYYPSGSLYSNQRFRDGLLDGKQQYYYENGQKKTQFNYSEGFLEGSVELYYANGKSKRTHPFHKGKLHGIERFWNEAGVLVIEAEYDSGAPVGKAKEWYQNGLLKMEKIYVDSKNNIDLRRWNDQGQLIYEKLYMPEKISEESIESGALLSDAVGQLKKRIEGLKGKLDE